MFVSVFASARTILKRLIGPRTRSDEVSDVRRRLAAQPEPSVTSAAEVRLALRLRVLREEISAQVGEVKACAQCVRPRSANWPGGHCCSGDTRSLFTNTELAALRLSGTTSAQLKPPRAEHSGCAFRGPRGCSLETAHRPSLCVRYMCRELESEVAKRSDARVIAESREQLRVEFERFSEMTQERALVRDDEQFFREAQASKD